MGHRFPLLAFLVVPYHFRIHYALRKLVSGSAPDIALISDI